MEERAFYEADTLIVDLPSRTTLPGGRVIRAAAVSNGVPVHVAPERCRRLIRDR